MASQAASGVEPTPWMLEPITDGGELLRVAQPVRSDGVTVGVVVASEYLAGNLAERSRRMTQAYEDYSQLRVLRQPLAGVYVSFFVMVTLFILVGATWLGLYLAKRITRPVQALSIAAREIGAGHYDHRIQLEAADEFGAMVDAFNTMAAEVASSRRRLERASVDLQRKHEEGESRRRYIEAVVERIATGVVSIDRTGRIGTINSAAIRLLELEPNATGLPAVDVFSRADLAPVNELLEQSARARTDALAQEIALVRDGRERHMAAAATRILGRRRRLRRHGAGRRRRHAADSRAEGGRLARGGAPAGARDQEPADADPALRRAHAAQAERSRAAAAGSRAGVHDDDHRRGGVAQGPGRRVLAVRAHAGAAGGADRPAPG